MLFKHYSKILVVLIATSVNANAALNIFACEPEWAELAKQVGGEAVDVFSATTALQDPHHIEARPSLIARIRKADFVICSGAELETGWLPLLLRRSGNPSIQPGKAGFLEAAMVVDRLGVRESVDRSEGDVHGKGNPHVHLDPERLAEVAEELGRRLATIDMANEKAYQSNTLLFTTSLHEKLSDWKELAARLEGKSVVIHHTDWDYLFDWTGIKTVTTIEPKPGLPPTGSDLKRLNSLLNQDKPDAIILAAYQNPKAANWLSEKLDVPVVILPFTIGGTDQATGFPQLFDETLELLLDATGGDSIGN